MEDDPFYSEDKRELYRDTLKDFRAEQQAKLEILPQNRKYLQIQISRIRQTK